MITKRAKIFAIEWWRIFVAICQKKQLRLFMNFALHTWQIFVTIRQKIIVAIVCMARERVGNMLTMRHLQLYRLCYACLCTPRCIPKHAGYYLASVWEICLVFASLATSPLLRLFMHLAMHRQVCRLLPRERSLRALLIKV